MLTPPSRSHTDSLSKTVLQQRSRPYLLILDADFNIAFVDPEALAVLALHFRQFERGTLPPALKTEITNVVEELSEDAGLSNRVIGPLAGLVLRVTRLEGSSSDFIAICFEEEARREDLRDVARRFSLTPREMEVLDLILGGMSAAEIAEGLNIAKVTVFDHFKHISDKTRARNRADMLAKVFNWQASLRYQQLLAPSITLGSRQAAKGSLEA